MQYSKAIRIGVLKKVLPPENQSISNVAKETGIPPKKDTKKCIIKTGGIKYEEK